jgi:hypothetical protein
MNKRLTTLVIVSLVALQAVAQDSTHRSATVGSGQEIRLNVYMNINRDCSAGAPPEVRVITPPRNGALSIRSGKGRSPRVGKCENIEVPVRLVIYQSNRGYIGEDHVVYEVKKADSTTEAQSVTIAVTPPSATSPTRKNDQSEKI